MAPVHGDRITVGLKQWYGWATWLGLVVLATTILALAAPLPAVADEPVEEDYFHKGLGHDTPVPEWAEGLPVHFQAPSGAGPIAEIAESEDFEIGSPDGVDPGPGLSQGSPFTYHGGAVVLAPPHVHVIFWGSNWEKAGAPTETRKEVTTLFSSISESPFQKLLTQYFESSNNATQPGYPAHIPAKVLFDPTAANYPARDIYVDTRTAAPAEVNRPAINQEIEEVVEAAGWPESLNQHYVLMAAPGSTYEQSFIGGFCAFHELISGGTFSFILNPGIQRGCPEGDGSRSYVAAFEYADAITDPVPHEGWSVSIYDEKGKRLGDWEAAEFCLGQPAGQLPSGAWVPALMDNYLWYTEERFCSPFDASPGQLQVGETTLEQGAPGEITLHSWVDPAGYPNVKYSFQKGGSGIWGGTFAADGVVNASSGLVKVSKTLTGNFAKFTKEFRLAVQIPTNEFQEERAGIARGPALSVPPRTWRPIVVTGAAGGVGGTVGTLHATVNPNYLATTYRFEYGTSSSYGSSIPVSPAAVGSGSADIEIEERLSGLEPATIYHYRIVAENSEGTSTGLDRTFTTLPWTAIAPAEPAGAQSSVLAGVSCPGGGECVAVGFHRTAAGALRALAERRSGTSWTVSSPPAPAGGDEIQLYDVACVTAGDCTAVGSYKDGSGTTRTLAEHFDGKDWSVVSTPNPVGSTESRLEGISCPATGSCLAVGYYKNSSGSARTLVERLGSEGWVVSSTPNPSTPQAYLRDVSCAATGDCWAVGDATFTIAEQLEGKVPGGLLEHFDGSAWSVQALPSGAPPLSAVSCVAQSACVALGGETAERYDGSGWTQSALPAPATDLDCHSASACTAVGSNIKEGNHSAPIAQHFDGTSWEAQEMTDAVGTIAGALSSSARAIACTGSSACTAVGYYKDKSLQERALVELHGPGALPSAVTEPATAVGSAGATLNATVNPHGEDTSYRFEYGKTTAYGASIPLPAKGIGSGSKAVSVSTPVSGLSNGTTYHFRVVAEGASGTTQGEDRSFETHSPRFEADQYPATVSAAQTTAHVFSAAGGTATCPVASFTAEASSANSELTVSPTYAGQECSAFGYTQSSVSMNGCTYNLHVSQQIEADRYKGPVDLKCPSGKEIEINAGPCTVKIPPQNNLNSVEFENKPATSPSSVSVKASVTGIRGTLTKNNFLCFFTAGEFTNGSYSGSATATAKNGAGSPIGVQVTGS